MRRLLIACLPLTVACADVGVPGQDVQEGVELLGGVTSYATPLATKQKLGVTEDNWRVIQETPAASDSRPAFAWSTVSVHTTECGQTGRLAISSS